MTNKLPSFVKQSLTAQPIGVLGDDLVMTYNTSGLISVNERFASEVKAQVQRGIEEIAFDLCMVSAGYADLDKTVSIVVLELPFGNAKLQVHVKTQLDGLTIMVMDNHGFVYQPEQKHLMGRSYSLKIADIRDLLISELKENVDAIDDFILNVSPSTRNTAKRSKYSDAAIPFMGGEVIASKYSKKRIVQQLGAAKLDGQHASMSFQDLLEQMLQQRFYDSMRSRSSYRSQGGSSRSLA
jgi:hypothetical protein